MNTTFHRTNTQAYIPQGISMALETTLDRIVSNCAFMPTLVETLVVIHHLLRLLLLLLFFVVAFTLLMLFCSYCPYAFRGVSNDDDADDEASVALIVYETALVSLCIDSICTPTFQIASLRAELTIPVLGNGLAYCSNSSHHINIITINTGVERRA
ncbi:hypothetical protein GQX74_010692 [Glossina fuscipes]|nr:hypothetical protein GQX74_010692 [Glossina fuscipes]